MDGLRGELEGTLARTAQKRQTTLSRYNRHLREQEKVKKYGFATRPSSTSQVTDAKAADHFYREVRAEFSDKLSRMNQHMSIESHGTAEIKVLNDDLNALRREMGRWSDRVVALGGKAVEAGGRRHVYTYFGAAKALPEAKAALEEAARSHSAGGGKRSRDEEDEEEDWDDASMFLAMAAEAEEAQMATAVQRKAFDDKLMPPVRLVLDADADEKALRREEVAQSMLVSGLFAPQRLAVAGYSLTFAANAIPSPASVWEEVMARKKAALRARLMKK